GSLSRLYRREVFDSSSPVLQISGLEATVHGGNRATIKWENATGPVSGYNMTVCLLSDPPGCQSATGQKTSYNLHRLESGRMYQVDVYAYFKDGGDTTNGRNERIFFTTTKLPSVENLEATPLGSTSVELNAIEEDKELSFGPATSVSATTTLLPGISDVVIRATCDHFIIASWDYASEGITGFLLNLCTEGQACMTRSVDKDDREHQFRVDPVRRLYTLSIEAYLWKGNAKHSSPVVNASVTSFPQVPTLDRFEVEPVSSSQVRVSWSNGFDADVRILVCVSQSTERNCANYVAHGTQKSYTISGLSSGTNGLPAVRELATLTEAFCRYDDDLMQTIKQISDNVKALTRRRSQFNPNRRDDDISTKCELIEAKLRTLPEKDVNDCFDDIDNLIETYKRKTSDLSSE
ncbi:hypothetical protein MTO96_014115, partial [Rhipicephalus appendiculatus]